MAQEVLYGRGADRLPGAEILADLKHGRQINDHIVKMPGGTFVRWFPVPGRMPPEAFPHNARGLLRLARETTNHHEALERQSHGAIRVNPYRSFIADMPKHRGRTAVITVTEQASGSELSYADRKGAPVVAGLARYLSWASRTRQPKTLTGVFYPWQYVTSWGSRQATLIDLDPELVQLRGYDFLKESLLSWEQQLGQHKPSPSVGKILEGLRKPVRIW